MWFEKLTGFKEVNSDQVQAKLNYSLDGFITSKVNGRKMRCGSLEIISLANLRNTCPNPRDYNSRISCQQIVGDVSKLHIDSHNNGAMFQAASQFNLLEMVSPYYSPENGIDGYENDFTQ